MEKFEEPFYKLMGDPGGKVTIKALEAARVDVLKGSEGSMIGLEAQVIMDYTTVPIGWWIEGRLWTGHSTKSTATCPSCGRTGVISAPEHGKQIMVHTGSVACNALTGIDYCEFGFAQNHIPLPSVAPNRRLYLNLESRTQSQAVIYAAAIAADESRQYNQRTNYARAVDVTTVGS